MSSKQWLKRHVSDYYVRLAKKQGYPSRSAFKLKELHEKQKLFKPGMTVVDLGATPGGWSMVAGELIGPSGHVVAVDVLPMTPPPGVRFILGDLTTDETWDELQEALINQPVDLILSDMAPNLSGERSVDQPRSIYLVELALEAARTLLCPGGAVVAKVFQGEGFDPLIKSMKNEYKKVKICKPKASRAHSREVYVLGLDFIRYNDRNHLN